MGDASLHTLKLYLDERSADWKERNSGSVFPRGVKTKIFTLQKDFSPLDVPWEIKRLREKENFDVNILILCSGAPVLSPSMFSPVALHKQMMDPLLDSATNAIGGPHLHVPWEIERLGEKENFDVNFLILCSGAPVLSPSMFSPVALHKQMMDPLLDSATNAIWGPYLCESTRLSFKVMPIYMNTINSLNLRRHEYDE